METLSDNIDNHHPDRLTIPTTNVKQFIKDLKESIRGIKPKEHKGSFFQDTIEIWKRIDKLAGEKLI